MEGNGGVKKLRKVQYAYYPVPSFYQERSATPHPVIRIAGKYLERFGFRIGDAIEVEIVDGRIMVRKLAEPDSSYAGTDANLRGSRTEKQ